MAATVVLVHGGFLGPWSWRDVVVALARAGVRSVPVELPSGMGGSGAAGDLHDDADRVREVLDEVPGPVVLCGHSYGGAVISEAAAGPHPRVRRLVYVAAAVPDVGESVADLAPVAPSAGVSEAVRVRADGLLELTAESAREALFHDVAPERAAEAIGLLRPNNPATGTQAVRGAAWREVPMTFVRGAADRMPELVSSGVRWGDVESVVVPGGHCPQWSRPGMVGELLAESAGCPGR
ncbi:alpha/beta hydrolase [Saccharopolyspora cebuensis]|uniref:Alpha/beta fold hydrolase n=1 Tax=Saccharopolyspora cebuensis TaxID=418759 RepID=A0ABV4CBV4_9PSEU